MGGIFEETVSGWIKPKSLARATASVRRLACSLPKIFRLWTLTVVNEGGQQLFVKTEMSP